MSSELITDTTLTDSQESETTEFISESREPLADSQEPETSESNSEGDTSPCDESQCDISQCEVSLIELQESETAEPQAANREPSAPIKVSAEIEKLRLSLEGASSEVKVETYLTFMKEQLNPQKSNFRDFWEARRDLAPCFRGFGDATLKTMQLERMQQLCEEAKGLKNILDEQSQFAMEQIELAIDGIEKELAQLESDPMYWHPAAVPQMVHFDLDFYEPRQGILSWLNSFSSRVGALRKELMKTEMRVRSKNKLFSQLSLVGDKIFPKRKELIREISETFVQDVENFTQKLLESKQLHVLSSKAEVKIWQGLAKELTLNTHAFKKTREQLSECWEYLKKLDKEFQQQRNAQKTERKGVFQQFQQQIDDIKKLHEAAQLPERVFVVKLDEIGRKLKNENLMREDQDALRDQIRVLKQPIVEREEQQREEQHSRQQALTRHRDLQVQAVLVRFEQQLEQQQVDALPAMQQELRQLQEKVVLSQEEKSQLDHAILALKNLVFERQIDDLFARAPGTRPENAADMLRQLFDLRAQLRLQLEQHKREAGASGMDFQRAMALSERARFEKERIERVESAIAKLQSELN